MTEREKFIFELAFRDAWGSATQHNQNIYIHKDISDAGKIVCKENIKTFCSGLISYNKEYIDFIENIKTICDFGLKVGAAQKVLSVILKTYWCMEKISEPSSCPLDSRVIKKCNVKNEKSKLVKWTCIESIQEYMNYINQIKDTIKPKTLADWELEFWNGTI
jgi:hypothetical protein